MQQRFSSRHGYAGAEEPITVREDAPSAFREAVIQIASEEGYDLPSQQRTLICRVLRVSPDRNNWSEHPNIADEVDGLIGCCKWYKVYDVAEAFYEAIAKAGPSVMYGAPSKGKAPQFEAKINEVLYEEGIGWKMEKGLFVYRGDQAFEVALDAAKGALAATGRGTAQQEIAEALKDLSRRPAPDRTGAVQHSTAALECLARDLCGDPKATLGKLINTRPDVLAFPRPLDTIAHSIWGYASEAGRHLQEGREPSAADAEFVATVSAALMTYLLGKIPAAPPPPPSTLLDFE